MKTYLWVAVFYALSVPVTIEAARLSKRLADPEVRARHVRTVSRIIETVTLIVGALVIWFGFLWLYERYGILFAD
ncbi:hypothetical protein IVA80_15140 [Bradyrhizobium sp. 139]|uniref:hypothetical protein n=1 Tax=Bradyrhizobium sp. 139 TaxID=2782616 RepID=UPI001FF8D0FE|nr:hypothetical protein [Bradyrhizobium sp. 139]MCK1742158.1 hypothetical protein [Bradyrhizobium sp. 139]